MSPPLASAIAALAVEYRSQVRRTDEQLAERIEAVLHAARAQQR